MHFSELWAQYESKVWYPVQAQHWFFFFSLNEQMDGNFEVKKNPCNTFYTFLIE